MKFAPLILAFLAALAGCSTTRVDAARGDIAYEPVENAAAPLPLDVLVMPFEDRTPGGIPKGELAAFGRSYAKVLRESKVFRSVSWQTSEAPPDLTLRGIVTEAQLYRNYGWISSWIAVYVASFGLLHPVAALVGLPYASDNASLALEARLYAPGGAPVFGPYRGRFEKKVYCNIYDDDTATEGFCTDPRKALQEVTGSSIREMLAGRPALDAFARSRPAVGGPPR